MLKYIEIAISARETKIFQFYALPKPRLFLHHIIVIRTKNTLETRAVFAIISK